MGTLLKYGIVSEVKKGFVRVFFEEDEIVSDWLPVMVRKSKSEKESWQLEENEHVVCLVDQHCEEGVVIGAIPNEQDTPDPGEAKGKFRKKFSDGTVFEYDVNSHKMTVDVKGQLEAKTTGACKIDAGTNLEGNAGVKATVQAPNIELTGSVKITGPLLVTGPTTAAAISAASLAAGAISTTGGGSITSEGDISVIGGISATGDVVAGTKSLKLHTHSGVQPGGGTSGPPV